MQIQKQRFCCRLVRSLMDEHGIDQDPRARKPCFGYACYYCRHAESCMAGETDLLYIPRQEIRELVAEESAYILNFDGSSIEAPPRSADQISIFQSLHPSIARALTSRVDRGRLGRNQIESWAQFVDVQKSQRNLFKNADDSAHSDFAKSLIGLVSRTERCPTPWCLTPASAGVKSICFLRNLVMNRFAVIGPSRCRRGRIAPGGASPSATQHFLIHFKTNDRLDH